ncbi:MAG: hypothetical protein M3Y36_03870 [Actinomycetota bacterium]|nr:hypothetical protein [Actinomycetota bacterium]
MNVRIPPALGRAQELTRIDLEPLRPPPSSRRIILAGVLSIVGSLIADALLVAAGKAILNPGAPFDKFNFASYATLTVIGVMGATVGWALLVRMTSQPRWFVIRAAVVVTVVLLIPDFAILPHDPTGPVVVLMTQHVAIAIITTALLLAVAPAGRGRSTPRASRPGPAWSSENVPAR